MATNVCTKCESAFCCPEYSACAAKAGCGTYLKCIGGCGVTAKCLMSCNAAYPGPALDGENLELCANTHCHPECLDVARL